MIIRKMTGCHDYSIEAAGKAVRNALANQYRQDIVITTTQPEVQMSIQEIEELGECPIFLPTGEIGLVIRWIESENEIGIQIPGDDEIRWVPASRVSAYAEILRVSAD